MKKPVGLCVCPSGVVTTTDFVVFVVVGLVVVVAVVVVFVVVVGVVFSEGRGVPMF
jgi:hypothetical protein